MIKKIAKKIYKIFFKETLTEKFFREEQENYQKGITYSINQAKAALQELSYDLVSSEFLKGLVDTGTDAIELVDKLIDKFGLLKTAIIGIGTVWGSQKLG